LWESYFNIPYIFTGISDNTYARQIASIAQDIAKDWSSGSGVSAATISSIGGMLNTLGGASALPSLASLNQSAWALAQSVPPSRRGFYASHTLMQFNLQLGGLTAMLQLQTAAIALAPTTPGGPVPNPSTGMAAVQAAADSLTVLRTLRRVTEGDASAWTGAGVGSLGPVVNVGAAYPLRALYLYDTLSDFEASQGSLFALQLALQAAPHTPLLPLRSQSWYLFEDYQKAVASNYPLVNFNPSWNLPTYVRSNCRVSDVQANTCSTGPDGGWYIKGSDARLTLQIMTSQTEELKAGEAYDVPKSTRIAMTSAKRLGLAASTPVPGAPPLIIYYTTDGTAPTTSSPSYVPGSPPRFSDMAGSNSSVVVKAMAWVDGVPTGQVTTTTWVSH
jgi:hypothetical protein